MLAGKPIVAHTYARTCEAQFVDYACVATDDARVAEPLEALSIPVVMTSPNHPSGTDRIAEVARDMDAEIVVNVQGDEPLIDPRTIDAAVQRLLDDPSVSMATARRKLDDPSDPNIVKVVCAQDGRALYFSRCPIPFPRDDKFAEHWQHIGLYAFRREFLLEYATMAPTPLEQTERLEQLRILENGHAIAVVDTEYEAIGVDTPEDLERVNARWNELAQALPEGNP